MTSVNEFDAVYRRFAALYANSHMIRTAYELEVAVRAAGLDIDRVSDAWLRSLSSSWVYGRAGAPFDDETTNKKYRRLLEA